jgi:hypothetical protein
MDRPQIVAPERPGYIPRCSSGNVKLWITVVISYFWMSLTMCICSHTSWDFSIGILPAFCFALYVFRVYPRRSRLEKFLGAIALSLIAVMLIKNIGDILYFGHSPLLR